MGTAPSLLARVTASEVSLSASMITKKTRAVQLMARAPHTRPTLPIACTAPPDDHSLCIFNGMHANARFLPVVPGPCGLFRSSATTDALISSVRAICSTPASRDGLVQGNLKIAEDRILSYLLVLTTIRDPETGAVRTWETHWVRGADANGRGGEGCVCIILRAWRASLCPNCHIRSVGIPVELMRSHDCCSLRHCSPAGALDRLLFRGGDDA